MRKPLPNLPRLYASLNAELFAGELPSTLPVVWNPRLRRSLGRAHYRTLGYRALHPTKIDIMTAYKSERALRKTMVHEMCHVWEFIKNGYGGHNVFFWTKMAECGYPKGHTFKGDTDGKEADIWSRSDKNFRVGDRTKVEAYLKGLPVTLFCTVTKVNRKTCRVLCDSPKKFAGNNYTCSKWTMTVPAGLKPAPKKPAHTIRPMGWSGGRKRMGGKRREVWVVLRDNMDGVYAEVIARAVWGDTSRKSMNNARCYISYLRKDGYNIVLKDGKYRWEV